MSPPFKSALKRLIFIILTTCVLRSAAELLAIFENEDLDLCNNQKCAPKQEPHTLCTTGEADICPSVNYQFIQLTARNIRNIVNGHNGLRNRMAKNKEKPAANMNYLHWDYDLAEMAEKWVRKCVMDTDPCNFIYNSNYTVAQNHVFVLKELTKRWPVIAIRKWYRESFDFNLDLVESLPESEFTNFTQLIWAKTSYVGCGAAKIYLGYVLFCNYHPKGNIANEPIYLKGEPCSECDDDHPTCSVVFTGLCGIDRISVSVQSAMIHTSSKELLFISCGISVAIFHVFCATHQFSLQFFAFS